jgi:hypothetical protein
VIEMAAVRLSGYWPAVDVIETDRPTVVPQPRSVPETAVEWLAGAHEPWARLAATMCAANVPQRRRYAACDDLITMVSRHSFAAVGVLYPVLAPALRKQDPELVPTLTADLVAAAQVMVRLEHLMRGDMRMRASAFPAYCAVLRDLLAAHTEREAALLPIVGALEEVHDHALAAALHASERHAPTRPHPHALAHHTALRVVGRLTHVIDALRDAMDNRPPLS